jgi:hypothetical protein
MRRHAAMLFIALLPAMMFSLPARAAEESPAGMPAAAVATGATEPAGNSPFREYPYRMWPFYYHRKFAPDHERTIYGPLTLTEREQETTMTYPLWPFTGVTRTRGDMAKLDIIWPFIGYRHEGAGEEFNLLWPATGYSRNVAPERESTEIYLARPLIGYSRETRRAPDDGRVTGESVGYLPFFYDSRTGDSTFRYVFPSFLAGEELAAGSYWHTLLPFYANSEKPDSSSLFVLPTYLRLREPDRDLHSFLPLYHFDERRDGSSSFVFPSYFHSESGAGDSLTGLLPLYLGGRGAAGDSFRYVFPTWYERHRRNYDSTWFLPFFVGIDDATGDTAVHRRSVLGPLYLNEERDDGSSRTSVLLNLFYRRVDTAADERFTTILWPLVTSGETPRHREFRIWPYSYEHDLTDNYSAHYLLWPLIGYGSGDRESMARVLPLYYRRSTPERSLTLIPPIFLQTRTPESRYSVFLPLYGSYTGTDGHWTVVPPVAWGENGEQRFSLVFPVWYRSSHGDNADNLLLNTWWSRDGERSSFAFIPIYYRSATPAGSESQVLNTWWSGGERLERFVFFPLAWYHSPAPAEQDFTLFPLFSYGKKGEDNATFSFLWRLYYQRQEGDSSMAALLWWLYRSEERPGYRRMLCWPFIDYERNTGDSDEVFSSFLLRFVTYERNRERQRVRLLGMTIHES